jgi:hypothetical protein
MKIIATTTGGFLCELSRREISLLGVTSGSIGDEVPLDRAFDTLDNLRGISRSNLTYLGESIRKLQAKFNDVEDAYTKTMLLDSIKNSKDTQ